MSRLVRTLLWLLVAAGLVAFLFFQVSYYMMAPLIYVVTTALAIAYVAIVVFLLSRSSLWPHGRAGGWVFAALLWGAGTSLILVQTVAKPAMQLADAAHWDASLSSWGGAYPEEISKALGVLFICLSFHQVNRPWHAMIVGMVVGLGFEASENAMYGAVGALYHPTSDWSGLWDMWGGRMVFGPGFHILCTALAGWGLGWALFAADWSIGKRLGRALGWVGLGFLAHFVWNYTPSPSWVSYITMGLAAAFLYPGAFLLWRHARRLAAADPGTYCAPGLCTDVEQLI